MRVCFLLPDLSPSGGVDVVLGHARRLAAHGIRATVLLTGRTGVPGAADGVDVRALADDRERWDVALATWWTTALLLPGVDAARRVVFAQSVDARFYAADEAAERLGAAVGPALADSFVAVGEGLAAALRTACPRADVHVVRNGIDKELFAPAAAREHAGPLRVLVEGQPGLAVKGVEEALAAVARMREPVSTSLVALDPPPAGATRADRVVGGLDRAEMAALYAEHDVLLKLSRHEGLSLPCLEAMHVGTPCVVTPFGGHADFLEHGRNGLLVGYDDPEGTAAALDLLSRRPALLARLRTGALAAMRDWPDPAAATARLADALRAIAEREPADGRAAGAEAARRSMAMVREQQRLAERRAQELAGEVEWHREALDGLHREIDRLNDLVGELFEDRDLQVRRLEEVTSSRAYRLAIRARGIVRRAR